MAALAPRDNPMHWPIDLFRARADYARAREAVLLQLDEKADFKHSVQEAGKARIEQTRLKKLGIPPLFIS